MDQNFKILFGKCVYCVYKIWLLFFKVWAYKFLNFYNFNSLYLRFKIIVNILLKIIIVYSENNGLFKYNR